MASKINLAQLREELKHITPRQELYKLLKDELSKQGHWKAQGRGKPFK